MDCFQKSCTALPLPAARGLQRAMSQVIGPAGGQAQISLAAEEELMREVCLLLDSMNRASSEINLLQRQACEAQLRYKRRLKHWVRLYEDLRSLCGHSFDHIKPYFDLAQVALECVQGAVWEFSLAHRLHDERDKLEWKCMDALDKHRKSLEALDMWRLQVGDAVIKRTLPCFRLLRQHQQRLAAEQSHINELEDRSRNAKTEYAQSLRKLEMINVAVHGVCQATETTNKKLGQAGGGPALSTDLRALVIVS